MGNAFTNLFNRFFEKTETRLVMLGLDAVGKTSILYRLHKGQTITTIPTIGFNVETIKYQNIQLTIWDIGGGDKIRALWRHYIGDARVCICYFIISYLVIG